jgi:hypothetical protein
MSYKVIDKDNVFKEIWCKKFEQFPAAAEKQIE